MPKITLLFLLLILAQPAFAADGAVIEGDHSGRKFYTLKPENRHYANPPAKFVSLRTVRPLAPPTRLPQLKAKKPIEKPTLSPQGTPEAHNLSPAQAQQILAIFAAKE